MRYDSFMRVGRCVLLIALAACTKPNPAATCDDGVCSDPAFPVCDTTGSIGGVPGECVAAPPCTPNTQTCEADTVSFCDDTGHVSSTAACNLGCADDTRCAELVPSNGLGQFLAMVSSPADLSLDGGTIDVDASTFTPDGGSAADAMPLDSFDLPAPESGAGIRVYVARTLTLNNVTVVTKAGAAVARGNVGRAIAFLATGDVNVTGRLEVDSGAIDLDGCTGGPGAVDKQVLTSPTHDYEAGGGGGGHATAGATGGAVPGKLIGGTRGESSGNEALVPLRGGCPQALLAGSYGSRGGGAIQITSLTTIEVAGAIAADALPELNLGRQAGGGGGGGILLEAPMISLRNIARLLVRGGPGSSTTTLASFDDTASTEVGAACTTDAQHCGVGGNGGSGQTLPTKGADTNTPLTNDEQEYAAGGGGGGVGRIRLNTSDGQILDDGAELNGARSTGTVEKH